MDVFVERILTEFNMLHFANVLFVGRRDPIETVPDLPSDSNAPDTIRIFERLHHREYRWGWAGASTSAGIRLMIGDDSAIVALSSSFQAFNSVLICVLSDIVFSASP